jgi:hypothetical protein
MNKIGVLLEMGLLLSGIVTNFTFEVLCTWFSSHFDFVKKNVSSKLFFRDCRPTKCRQKKKM